MMESQYIPIEGNIVDIEELETLKAKEMIEFLQLEQFPYANLIECRKLESKESIVLDVVVQVGQKPANDIQGKERIAIVFDKNDQNMPEVLALRSDFPSVSHINLRDKEFPRSLCLFDLPYSELRHRWNSFFLINTIREWLALTAKSVLHAEDQPLEPLLMGSNIPLIMPYDLLDDGELFQAVEVWGWENPDGTIVLAADKVKNIGEKKYIAITIKSSAQEHGVIRSSPSNIKELNNFLAKANCNLIAELHTHLKQWSSDSEKLASKLIIVTYLPKIRAKEEKIESTDIWAFLTDKTIREIGVDVGCWDLHDNQPGILMDTDTQKKGEETNLIILNPTFTLSRSKANYLNGINYETEKKNIVAVGVGALGSQIFMNLIRGGYGEWVVVDSDYLLPHNLSRHELNGFAIGLPKSYAMCDFANSIISEKGIAEAIMADVLNPGEKKETLNESYQKADIILDMSASIAVPKHLTFDINSNARRISIFLNPLGADLVILAEDRERKIRLDHVEAQYYNELISHSCFADYAEVNKQSVRYARSCKDLTNRIPQDFVSLHSSIASKILKSISSNSLIGIWKIDSETLNVSSFKKTPEIPIELEPSNVYKSKEWKVFSYPYLINKLKKIRKEKLPKETGGVLIGSYDFDRKIVYVLNSITAPSDSIEKPTSFIRGKNQLKEQINRTLARTSEMVDYVGEWHSHPDNCDLIPSNDDRDLFTFLNKEMLINSRPTLMAIVGDKKVNWLFEGL